MGPAKPYPSTAELEPGGFDRTAPTSLDKMRSHASSTGMRWPELTTVDNASLSSLLASLTGVQSTPGGSAKQSFRSGGGWISGM